MHMPFDEKMKIYRDLIAPFEEAHLRETHVPYRVTLSLSSVHSRYGEPFVHEMVDPIDDFFERACGAIRTTLPPRKRKNQIFHLLIALGRPVYSINRRELGFKNNNFGHFPQGIILVPEFSNFHYDQSMCFDFLVNKYDHGVIVEGVNFKPIVGQMQNPADFMNRVFRRHCFERNRLISLEY